MSLIHLALDKMERLGSKPVKNVETPQVAKVPIPAENTESPVSDHEPRMDSIQFYESLNQETEKSIYKITKPAFWKDQKIILGLISFLLFCSLFATRWMMPSVTKDFSDTPQFYQPAMPQRTSLPQNLHPKSALPPEAQKSRFVLTGITSTEETRLAVINGQVVGAGDKLRGGGQIKSITDKKVVINYQFRDITLSFE